MRKPAPLAVEVPGPERDNPAWVKVGVVAAVGFVIGIAWPRVMGVRLGPSAPGESAAAAASASASAAAARASEAPPAKGAAATTASGVAKPADVGSAAASMVAPTASGAAGVVMPTVTVNRGSVISCKTTDGETKKGNKECGPIPALDALVQPRLKKLAACEAAERQSGKLSVVVTADFAGNKFGHDVGKSSTVANVEGLGACAKKEFAGITLGNAAHEHARYTVAYNAVFAAAGGAKEEPKDATPASARSDKASDKPSEKTDKPSEKTDKPSEKTDKPGEATVAWEVALVRDTPKTGDVVARLPRGTKVKVGTLKEGWYGIKFGDGFGTDGYVYRGAIGR
jgi:hypothetical protein